MAHVYTVHKINGLGEQHLCNVMCNRVTDVQSTMYTRYMSVIIVTYLSSWSSLTGPVLSSWLYMHSPDSSVVH